MTKKVNVEMYYKDSCPYCIKAKNLLENKEVDLLEYPAAKEPNLFKEMQERSNGRRTFPQIFINGQHIGGCDDLYRLETEGQLDRLLSS